MNLLGLAQSHCSSACLMRDGGLIGMVQEERLSKRKNQVAFPKLAIEEMLADHLDGDASKLDLVVFAEHEIDPYGIALDRYSEFSVANHIAEQHALWRPHFYGDGSFDTGAYWRDEYLSGRHPNHDHNHDLAFMADMDWQAASRHFSDVERVAAMARHFDWQGETTTVDHHTCHAYYALYGNRLTDAQRADALVLTADAWGEGRNWTASLIEDDGRLREIAGGREHSVARLYKFVTLILGMKPNEHEYKVMGLAPYSRSTRHIEETERVFFEALDFRDGAFVSDRPLTNSYFDLRERLEGHRFDNISAALQNWTSKLTGAWAQHWLAETDKSVLCFSGGLSMNIRMTGDLLSLPGVDYLSVPASGGDEALCAGACFATMAERGAAPKPLDHVYLGSPPRGTEWTSRITEVAASPDDFGVLENVGVDELARLLAADRVVARCAGRGEFGARALGNRSILANPANPENVKTINEAIKNRDFWMPFTPSILSEHADTLLENPKSVASPYMTIGYASKPEARRKIPAALHFADHSARPQFVDRETNPDYWELIEAFRRITGIPALLNTSLNLHGEPMNYTVADAARTVALSELDYLILPDNRLLYKKRAQSDLSEIVGRSAEAA